MNGNKSSILEEIKESVLGEGIKEGTPKFEKRFRQLHVVQCREMRGYVTCQECPFNDSCDLYVQVKRDYYGVE